MKRTALVLALAALALAQTLTYKYTYVAALHLSNVEALGSTIDGTITFNVIDFAGDVVRVQVVGKITVHVQHTYFGSVIASDTYTKTINKVIDLPVAKSPFAKPSDFDLHGLLQALGFDVYPVVPSDKGCTFSYCHGSVCEYATVQGSKLYDYKYKDIMANAKEGYLEAAKYGVTLVTPQGYKVCEVKLAFKLAK
jgi:hypothetical protein